MARRQAHPKKTGDRFRSARPSALSVGLVVLVAVLPHLPGLNAPFMLDDRFRIEHNPEIRSPAAWWNAPARLPTDGTPHRNDPSRPLTSFTFMLNAAATGVCPGAFRAVNIALHAFTAVLLLLLARRLCTTLLPDRVAAVVAAGVTVLWASHPVHAATVTYLSGRAEILAAAGMFGTVLLFLGGRPGWSLAVCALALLAKPNAAAAPLLLLAADCAAGCGSWRAVRWSRHAPFWALVIAYVLGRRLLLGAVGDIEGGSGVMPVPEYLAAMPHALAAYLRLLVIPVRLSLDHAVFRPSEAGWPMVALPAFLLCTLGAVVWAAFRRIPEGRAVLFGAVWFVVALLPTSSVLPTVNPVVETRLYPAAFGVLLAIAAAIFVAYDRLRFPALVYRVTIASACCVLASLTGARAALMARPERHWQATLTANPSSLRAHNELGMHYAAQGRYGEATDAFRAILSAQQDNAEARANLDKGIGYAQRLGASCICLGTGSIPGESLGFQIRRFLEYFPAVADRLHQAGIVPVFYAGHGATILNDLAAFEAVWEHLPDLKIKFDPANWRHMGQDYLEVCRRYARKIGHVHIKENTWHQGKLIGEPPAGMGDIEFPKVLAFLYEADYQGWLSLEPHGPLWSKPPLREKMLLLSKRSLDPMLL